MSKKSGAGFGGFLIGLGLTWYILRYINLDMEISPYLLILAGILVISLGFLRSSNSEYSEIIGGLIGGIILGAIFSSVSGSTGLFPFGNSVVGSNTVTIQEYDFRGFSKIVVSNGFNVQISTGSNYKATVTISDNLVNYLNIREDGDTLRIGLKSGSYSNTKLEAEVITPSLSELILSDGSDVESTTIESSSFYLSLSDGSQATLSGSIDDIKVIASDGSRVYLSGLEANNADVTFSDGSRGSVYADGVLDVNLSDGSHLEYYGDPTLGDINLIGGSTITPK